jgi:hypothetical protein
MPFVGTRRIAASFTLRAFPVPVTGLRLFIALPAFAVRTMFLIRR